METFLGFGVRLSSREVTNPFHQAKHELAQVWSPVSGS